MAIPKASTPEHLKENLALEDFTLSPEDRTALNTLAQGLRLISPSFAPRWEEDP